MQSSRRGVAYGLGAYLIWGSFPLLFHLLRESTAVEIVLHRVAWSLAVCLTVLAAIRGWAGLRPALRSTRSLGWLALAAVVLAVNWGVYVYSVATAQVVEASLGYFINPLVTVLLGVVLLQERLRPAQWGAVAIGAMAVTVLAVDYGRLPWIALTLAISFGTYGLAKNRVGADVGALASLTTESMILMPVAVAGLVWFGATGRATFGHNPPWQALLLVGAGVATVVPLVLFAASARRVPLSTLGLMQYLTPGLQLGLAVLVLDEHMPGSRWVGFGLVWLALAVLTTDSLRSARLRRRAPVAVAAGASGAVLDDASATGATSPGDTSTGDASATAAAAQAAAAEAR